MKEGTEHLGLKVFSLAALGVALHFFWRWHSRSNASDREQENHPSELPQREPLLDSAEDAPFTSPQDEVPPHHLPEPAAYNKSSTTNLTSAPTIAAAPAAPAIPLFSQYADWGYTANVTATEAHSSPSLGEFYSPAASSITHEHDAAFTGSATFSPDKEGEVSPASPAQLSARSRMSSAQESPFHNPPEEFLPIGEASDFLGFAGAAGVALTPEESPEASGLAGSELPGHALTPPPPSSLPKMDRSFTLHSAASDRRLARVVEEEEIESDDGHIRTSMDIDVRLALKLDVISGPPMKTSYVTGEDTIEVHIGRAPDNDLVVPDGEVSGKHAHVSWSTLQRCWQITDLGSLNGTCLNGESISAAGRVKGEQYRLCTDDIIQLGTMTKLKVSVFPREMLPENAFDRSLSLSLGPGSLPRSLTMPKHRIPSFTSLLTPKINSPSKQAVVAAASDELRLECCIAAATGRDHARRNQACEDVALAECPLHGSDVALGPGSIAALFCVFDGHCGRGAADAASMVLPDEVSERLATPEGAAGLLSGEGARDLLHDAFLATDDRINSEEGCTATAVLAWRGADGAVLLQCGNVGDSAALLVDVDSGGWKVLTEDHRLTNPAERDRLARNGIPLHSDSKRLYGLNLARALGDKFLKDEDLGLSAEPAVSEVAAIPLHQGALLVIASDGLWDVLDSEKVAGVAAAADKEEDGSVVEIAAAIVAAAKKAGTRDDVTALVVRLWPEDEWELRSPLMTLDDGQVASFEAP